MLPSIVSPDRLTRGRIGVLISGGGTTLRNLIACRAAGKLAAEFGGVISSHAEAGGLAFARQAGIATEIVDFRRTPEAEFHGAIFRALRGWRVDWVVLGGFLRHLQIPDDFAHRIVNIHPSLIPAFCGRGFYGLRVHQAVLEYGCRLSGCTVHFVDSWYDHGPIIAQQAVPVLDGDTPETLAARVFEAECRLYPAVIHALATGSLAIDGRRVHLDPPPRVPSQIDW